MVRFALALTNGTSVRLPFSASERSSGCHLRDEKAKSVASAAGDCRIFSSALPDSG
jgi:hypothetical protein